MKKSTTYVPDTYCYPLDLFVTSSLMRTAFLSPQADVEWPEIVWLVIPSIPPSLFFICYLYKTKTKDLKRKQTSTNVVHMEAPIQQKRDTRPITSARSLFYKSIVFVFSHFQSQDKNKAQKRIVFMYLVYASSVKPNNLIKK